MSTLTEGRSATPAVAVPGCWPMARCVAAPGLTTKLFDAELVSDNAASAALKLYVPAAVKIRLENVATPELTTALVVLPPARPAGPLATPIVNVVALSDVSTLPY